MTRTLKTTGTTLVAFLLSLNLFAERRVPPSPEEMHEKKWEYISATAQLTEAEQLAVKPIFLQHEQSMWELHKKYHHRRPKGETPDYEELNERYINREMEQANLLLSYHEALKKVLTPERLYKYYKAERSHKRHLIYEMQQMHPRRPEPDDTPRPPHEGRP